MLDFLAVVVALTLLALVPVAFVFISRRPVLEGKCFPKLRGYYLMLIPPADLYSPLIFKRISTDQPECTYHADFKHRYIGPYQLMLETPGTIPVQGISDFDLGLTIDNNFYVDGKLVFSKNYSGLSGNEAIAAI